MCNDVSHTFVQFMIHIEIKENFITKLKKKTTAHKKMQNLDVISNVVCGILIHSLDWVRSSVYGRYLANATIPR